jgi:two-component system, sensor histidine kinase PdtaS
VKDEAREALEDMQSRIESMAKVHEILSATEWAPLALGDLAERIIRGALGGSPIQDGMKLTVASPGNPVRLTSKQAVQAALIFNELTTNCIKYAFKGRNRGSIAVRIAVDDDPGGGAPPGGRMKVKLEFHDDGAGFPEDVLAGKRTGTGLRLIGIMVRDDLEGELTFRNENGAIAEFTLMLDSVNG